MSHHVGNQDTKIWASAAYASGTMWFSPCGGDRSHVHFLGLVLGERALPLLIFFTASPALVKVLPHLLIAFQHLLPAHTSLSF